MSDLLGGDDRRHVQPEWRWGQPNEGPQILRVAASDDIEPGGSGRCRIVDWNGNDIASSDREIMVYDPQHILCALKALADENGDRFVVFWNTDSHHWEPIGEFGLNRTATLTGNLAQGGTSTATLDKYDGATMDATAVSVDCYDRYLQVGADDILSGIQVELVYDRDRDSWRVTAAQCAA